MVPKLCGAKSTSFLPRAENLCPLDKGWGVGKAPQGYKATIASSAKCCALKEKRALCSSSRQKSYLPPTFACRCSFVLPTPSHVECQRPQSDQHCFQRNEMMIMLAFLLLHTTTLFVCNTLTIFRYAPILPYLLSHYFSIHRCN